jgi:CheY-like chemotaxis protein
MSDTGPGPNEASASPARLRVLLLDDDGFMLELLHEMLKEIGSFEVFPETAARRALATLASAQPDLLICDLSMPDMDGIEFMHAAAGAGFSGCVMLLSGMDAGVRKAAERLARANGLRVLGAYKKPISQAELRAALAPLVAGDAQACEDGPPN